MPLDGERVLDPTLPAGPAGGQPAGSDLSGYLTPELLPLLGDAVTVLGPDWRYRWVSPAAAVIIGRSAQECVGAHVWELFPEVVGTPQHAAVVRAMEQRTREVLSWHFDTVDRWYEQHALPAGDGIVVVVHDITERMDEVQRAEHLAVVGEALAGAASVEDVNAALGAHVHPLVHATAGSVVLALDERSELRAIGWTGQGADAAARWQTFSSDERTPSAEAHRSGQPVFVADLDDARSRFPAIVPALERMGAGPAAALPLVSGGVRLGAWSLTFPEGRVLAAGERRFLATAAAMVAQALLRTRLLAAEQRWVAQLQRSLLPRRLAPVEGLDLAVRYAAGDDAVAVGGDWYDVVPLGEGSVGLVLGDVEGHDVEAAAAMGLVRSAVRAYASEGHPPAVVVQLANAFVHDVGLGRLVTLSYTSLHAGQHLLTTVSAGHLPLHVVGPDGAWWQVPGETGPPLGVHADGARWQETTCALPPGGLVTAFTDGLVEVRGEDIDEGLARVRDVLVASRTSPADEVADALLAARSGRSADDVALLVGRLTAPVGPERRAARRMPASPASVVLVRRSTSQLLTAWGVEPDLVQDAELVVTELVTNAARHSEDALDVVLACDDDVVRLEVTDTSHRMPLAPTGEVDEDATSGRGLVIVEALAARWGVQSEGLGKRVWAELDRRA